VILVVYGKIDQSQLKQSKNHSSVDKNAVPLSEFKPDPRFQKHRVGYFKYRR